MRKPVLTSLFLFLFILPATANHIKGGFFTYTYQGAGILNPSNLRYQVTLTVYMECNPPPSEGQLNNPINFSIFDAGTNKFLIDVSVPITRLYVLSKTHDEQCISGNQAVCYYTIVEYNLPSIELPPNVNGYTFSYQRCCRIGSINNITNSSTIGNTWSITIPGSAVFPGAEKNNSPRFSVNDTAVICSDGYFQFPFVAVDPDGDSLTYEFCDAWEGGSVPNSSPVTADPPPYPVVPYKPPFSGSQPMGPEVTINRQNGLISGIAPSTAGEYVVTVCLTEYRNGISIAKTRKELHIRAGDCQSVTPRLDPQYITCDGYSLSFQNINPNPLIQTYFWDFGVTTSNDDTSNIPAPGFTYSDPGTYSVKLFVNRGLTCTDSATAIAKVYPGFFPGFTYNGICINKTTQFTDTTKTLYGSVDSWRWDFGVGGSGNDTSTMQNPSWIFNQTGNYNIRLIVTNSKGCIDTAFKAVDIIDKPPITLAFRDTLICTPDNVQLQAAGNGIFSWTPLTNITNQNTGTPTVNPSTTSWYYVSLNNNGCMNQDSVKVRVVDHVTLTARVDTIICKRDLVQLGAVSDGLKFLWSPSGTVSDPQVINPLANPAVTTTYQITSKIGSCQAVDDVMIKVVPYPFVNAGNDTIICYNSNVQLNGTFQGISFSWIPAILLNDPNILNPVVTLRNSTAFILSAIDTLGCPKPGRDTVFVTVLPKINAFAGNDTIIVTGQPLQLHATGGINYFWTPPMALNAVNIPDPIAILDAAIDSIRYKVYVSNLAGCLDSASVNIKIFKTNPQVFVPTAFTPNSDGLNDLLRPIAVGMKQINYFRVYNRWGQLVFSTNINGKGWDGKISGKEQSTNVFVWLVHGVDYLNRPFFQKGTVTLIR